MSHVPSSLTLILYQIRAYRNPKQRSLLLAVPRIFRFHVVDAAFTYCGAFSVPPLNNKVIPRLRVLELSFTQLIGLGGFFHDTLPVFLHLISQCNDSQSSPL